MFDPIHIGRNAALYPAVLRSFLADQAPASLTVRGNSDVLVGKKPRPLVALFCSVQCSGDIILQTYDLTRALCDAGVTVISGFHSPMEKECLHVLLGRGNPVIVCPARSIDRMRVPADWKTALSQNRLLLLSPFTEKERRVTTGRAQWRNEFVAALADSVLIAHATPGGKTGRFCQVLRRWGKPLLALENEENAGLFTLGAVPVRPDSLTPLYMPAGIA
jgi:predicted Rossmann fold nucleotide-binding protein DprA/Smf involved in DNA uptake